MQCKYCGATLPDIDYPTTYKELQEEIGKDTYERDEAYKEVE